MRQTQKFPVSAWIEKGWNWFSNSGERVEKAFYKCENFACRQPRDPWNLLAHKGEGIRFQGQWYCSPNCFEFAAESAFSKLLPGTPDSPKSLHRIPIGLLLLSRGTINDGQLKQALLLQREKKSGQKIGKILQEIQAASEQDITETLAAQWGCPTYPLKKAREFLQCASMLPLTLLEAGRILPVHYLRLQETLFLAFVDGVDRTILYAVEQMLHVRTVPCIVSESDLSYALETFRPLAGAPTSVFESPSDPQQMARTSRSYALQMNAKEVWAVRSGRFIWVRMQTSPGYKDILFQSPAGIH
jgi:Type II secretion system (T2SS), protein E, N-terminal domain